MSEIAVLEDGEWRDVQQSVTAIFGGSPDRLRDGWPRAGAVRGLRARHRPPGAPRSHATARTTDVWPTPRSRDRQPLGATEWELTGRPVRMDLLHVRVARLRPDLWVTDESLTVAERTPALNPLFVELLMGFPSGWTEMSVDG